MSKSSEILNLLEEAAIDGCITCSNCHSTLEADGEKCSCGWINPLPVQGYI